MVGRDIGKLVSDAECTGKESATLKKVEGVIAAGNSAFDKKVVAAGVVV